MKTLQCEMCGSNDLIKADGFYVCQHCGTKYTPEEAKKLFIDGTVKIDDSETISNLYTLARRAIRDENYDSGQKYYEQILLKNPNDWEAYFYAIYCKVWNCSIAQMAYATSQLTDALPTIFELILRLNSKQLSERALTEISSRLLALDQSLYNTAVSNYKGLDNSIKSQFLQEYVNRVLETILLAYGLGDGIENCFGEEYSQLSVKAWKQGVEQHSALMPNLAKKQIQTAEMMKRVESIQKYVPDYSISPTSSKSSEGCYIATAVYGSYDCPQVWTLRRYRDYSLKKTCIGRAFIQVYYATSPLLVKLFGHTKWFNRFFKAILNKKVDRLSRAGYKNTPYKD